MPADHHSTEALESDACYLAMKTHDARFDGSFFTAVTSTGIYCRPVCRVKLPRRENCRFFRHAAQAEAAGFRPCLRCRPELAPRASGAASWSTEDASRILAQQAARLIDEPDAWSEDGPGAAQIAARLGVSDRHLRRIFESQFGVSPLQYLQTRRLLAAKQLIADTRLPMTQVALASGFASVRRFNAAFLEHYGLNPSALRRAGGGADNGSAGGHGKAIEVRLGFRPPYDANAMLGFFARRALRGVEVVSTADGKEPAKGSTPDYVKLTRTLRIQQGAQAHAGWLQLGFDLQREQMLLSVSDSLAAVLPIVISRARALFDLDAEPMAINAALHAAFPHGVGERRAVEHVALGLNDTGEDMPDFAGRLVLAVGAAPVGNLAQARQRRDRSVDKAQHFAESELVGRPQQHIAAEPTAAAHDDSGALQLQQDLLEKLLRDRLGFRDFGNHQRTLRRHLAECDQGPQRVFGLLRDHRMPTGSVGI